MASDPLALVRETAADKRRAEIAYRSAVQAVHQAIREAAASGIGWARIGRAAGVSRQAARKVAQ